MNIWFFISLFVALALLFFPLWLPSIGNYLVVSDPLKKSDAVVILAGDENERIAYGAQIFQQGYAKWFILTNIRLEGEQSEGNYARVVKRKAFLHGVSEESILVVDQEVSTTYEEAVEIRSFAMQRGFRSLIVVTSPYHTRRAHWILNQVFRGTGINLIICPALTHNYRPEVWWKSSQDRNYTSMEYLKLIAHLMGIRHYGFTP